MQNQNWWFFSKVIIVATLTVLVVSFTTFAAAQSDAVRAIYDASATVATNIPGIRTFNAPPAGYNPVTASDEENATYGFPPRPDKQNDAAGYALWARAMAAAKTRWNGELKVTDLYSKPARAAKAPPGAAALSATPTTKYYYNWSGFINTNTLKKYNVNTSFYAIWSDFNVPVAQQAFNGSGGNICDGGWDEEVSWNGIDGNQNQNALL